jgi:hypothetical protein
MIIIPDPFPRPPTDYEGGLKSLSRRTLMIVAILALVPAVLGIIGLFSGSSSVAVLGFSLSFLIWGGIGAYIAAQSDRIRDRRRRERRQPRVLEGSDLSLEERRAALRDSWINRERPQ